jgi:uncharacterized lipoprotein YmbA
MKRHTQVMTLILAALSFGGCFKLARTSPPVERYVLGGALLSTMSATRNDPSALSIGLRRLDLAPYLSTLAIVVRRANNQIVTTGFHRWAESPSTGLNRALSGYLGSAANIRAVDVAPWPVRAEHDYIVQIHVTRFEGVAAERGGGGEAHLLSRWEIIRPGDGALMARGITDVRSRDWTIDDYAGLVTSLDNALLQLSQDVLSCLSRLGPATAPLPADSAGFGTLRNPSLECSAPAAGTPER